METSDRISVPVLTVDADAGYPPKVREAGAALGRLHGWDTIKVVIAARHALAEALEDELGADGTASALADVAVLHAISKLTAADVLRLVHEQADLVVEMKRLVEAKEGAARC